MGCTPTAWPGARKYDAVPSDSATTSAWRAGHHSADSSQNLDRRTTITSKGAPSTGALGVTCSGTSSHCGMPAQSRP